MTVVTVLVDVDFTVEVDERGEGGSGVGESGVGESGVGESGVGEMEGTASRSGETVRVSLTCPIVLVVVSH